MLLMVAVLAVPSPAVAQRNQFFSAVVAFYRSSAGLYGDEGPRLTAHVAAMSTALDRWDREILDAERRLRARLRAADDLQTKLQIHTTLASLYMERGRMADAAREFDEDIQLDPRRAAFHRLKGLVLQAAGRHVDAADAFRTAWLSDPADRRNAYRLIASRSPLTTAHEIERARQTLADAERGLLRPGRHAPSAPFTNVRAIVDAAGGGMAFVPHPYARGIASILEGALDRGVAELRAALGGDPLVGDPASRSEPMARGIAALRQAASVEASAPDGAMAAAIEHLQAAVAAAAGSSEAHRILATAYAITGDIAGTVDHLRDAVRLNPRDERSRLALARILVTAGRSADADDVLRAAVAELPDAAALRWRLSIRSQAQQDEADRTLIDAADRLVLLVGKGELYIALAGLAQLHRDDEQAISLLEQAVRLTPNHAAAHQALGRAYVESGREPEGYAELVVALMLDPNDVDTLVALGRWHLTADAGDSVDRAVEALDRAVAIAPTNRFAVHALAGALMRIGRSRDGTQRLQDSERLHAQAIEADRRAKTASVRRLSAEMRMAAGDFAGAVDSWRDAILLEPGSAAVHLRLAEALIAARRPDDAVAEYRTAIALDAGADAHRRLAELYDSLGRAGEAARERAIHVERRLEELRQRAEQGVYGV